MAGDEKFGRSAIIPYPEAGKSLLNEVSKTGNQKLIASNFFCHISALDTAENG